MRTHENRGIINWMVRASARWWKHRNMYGKGRFRFRFISMSRKSPPSLPHSPLWYFFSLIIISFFVTSCFRLFLFVYKLIFFWWFLSDLSSSYRVPAFVDSSYKASFQWYTSSRGRHRLVWVQRVAPQMVYRVSVFLINLTWLKLTHVHSKDEMMVHQDWKFLYLFRSIEQTLCM